MITKWTAPLVKNLVTLVVSLSTVPGDSPGSLTRHDVSDQGTSDGRPSISKQ
jgi:hypothetical protein